MPQTKTQKAIFGIIMSFLMVYGMETYNRAIQMRGLINAGFSISLVEWAVLAFVVFLIENLFGGPLARKLAFRLVNPKKDKEFFIILAIQIMTVCTMCPSMSLVASILFKGALKGHFLAIWIQTVAINFPMALIWQIFICGPLDRLFYRKVMLPVSNLIVSFGKEKTF